jgi:hypothetical protein
MITAMFVWCIARHLIPAEALWGSVISDLIIIGIVFDAIVKIVTIGKNKK